VKAAQNKKPKNSMLSPRIAPSVNRSRDKPNAHAFFSIDFLVINTMITMIPSRKDKRATSKNKRFDFMDF
jgi:hypothetical protein